MFLRTVIKQLNLKFKTNENPHGSGFGGLVVSMLASGTQVLGFKPDRSHQIFWAKNPWHAFLHRECKAVGPMSQLCGM
jgi:hypothetical protein